MKMTIGWHQECLHNQKLSLERDLADIQRRVQRYAKDKKALEFRALQIKRAKEAGKDSFDESRFLIKRVDNE